MRTEGSVQLIASRSRAGRRGFTIIELVVVLGIIIVVVGLLSTALNQTRTRTMGIICLDNMKQLQIAWGMYADEHNDHFALNKTSPRGSSMASLARSSTNSWVVGNPKEDRTVDNLMRGSLFPYVNHPEVYKCPMDSSMTRNGNPRVRSYSVSAYLGGDDDDLDPRVKMRAPELRNPPPEKVFVFIEEHEESVWSGGFLVLPRETFSLNAGTWNSTPSDRHMQGCNLSFADGHLEYWKWLAPKKPKLSNQIINSAKDLKDLRRLQESVPKP